MVEVTVEPHPKRDRVERMRNSLMSEEGEVPITSFLSSLSL